MSGEIRLKNLVGLHVLTGCQYGSIDKKDEYGEAISVNTMDFILDGRILSAVEDPDDGYRSLLDCIIENRHGLLMTNTFKPCEVFAGIRDSEEIIDFFDTTTGRIVISIGTDRSDDYYPCFVDRFHPENMAINSKKRR